jgi:hypothetical protein
MRNSLLTVLGIITIGFCFPAAATAQTASQSAEIPKTIPRTPDGKPDLTGTWYPGRLTGGEFAGQTAGPTGGKGTLQRTKWGDEKITWNRGPETANVAGVYGGQQVRLELDPVHHCYPPGLVRLGPPVNVGIVENNAVEILRSPEKLTLIQSYRNSIRRIYTDGRDHPRNLELTWNGHSIGKWDGDTFVVDTIGLRDESWLDTGGNEHSDQLHVVERFTRTAPDRMEIERTIADPIALAKPFTTKVTLRLRPDVDLDDNMTGRQYDCSQFMVRKSAFGEGENSLLGIAEPTTGKY